MRREIQENNLQHVVRGVREGRGGRLVSNIEFYYKAFRAQEAKVGKAEILGTIRHSQG